MNDSIVRSFYDDLFAFRNSDPHTRKIEADLRRLHGTSTSSTKQQASNSKGRKEVSLKDFMKAVTEINERDRTIILMRGFQKLSNDQVAAKLRLTESAARIRYLQAMGRVRAVLDGDDR